MTSTAATANRQQRAIIAEVDQWHVAPEDGGQMIEVAYGAAGESACMVRRMTDRTDGSVTYQIAELPADFAPWNSAPDSDEWSDVIAVN